MATKYLDKPAPLWAKLIAKHRGLLVPIAFISLLAVILVPLPPIMLDALIAINISIAVIMLLTTVYMDDALEFSVFPSLLLATTLMRLVINIASTRLILTADAASPEEAVGVAGEVISAFGSFVAGDSLVVGLIIFLILVIVQFVVITKGATRISEVAARFTLDAMPGKQMAIDADLNAGLINEQDAKERRERISDEADFFGAMDGASKFVRGDAVAGIIITVVNIVGGFAVGALEKGWGMAESASVFTRLTIGDGLVSQVPAFVISISAGLIVTRAGAKQSLGDEVTSQLSSKPVALIIASIFMGILAFTPLPALPLLSASIAMGVIALYMIKQTRSDKAGAQQTEREQATGAKPEPPAVETLLKVDTMELEVGYGLVSLVDANQGGDLLDRISAIRRQTAVEIGMVMPPCRIRDNMTLEPTVYRIKIRGAGVAEGVIHPDRLLAMDSGIATGRIEGLPTREPAFGLDAWWIEPALKPRAEAMNYTVVDASSVLATHLTEVVKRHAAELLTRDEVNNLVEQLKQKSPKLVEEAIPGIIKVGELQKVLQNLLRERVSIRDMETIVETLADWAPKTKDMDVLTEYVRNALRRSICQQHAVPVDTASGGSVENDSRSGAGQRIICVTLDPAFEDMINGYIDRSGAGTTLTMPARVANATARRIIEALQPAISAGHQPVVLASPQVRGVVRQILEAHLPNTAVLGYNEIVPEVEVESVGLVTTPEEAAAVSAA
ncbi:MAG: flagellar biosynthesis protein FlhA [Phycisphaeraceae bacterium]|nr:MAG: flagellar biosynthesis protein FlhA [Phycisphaeraceae bacterium]